MKTSNGYKIFSFFNYIFMLFILFVAAYPVYYVIVASISDAGALARNEGILLYPLEPLSINAYEMVFSNRLILSGFRNTLIILVVGVLVNLIMTCLGAYFMTIKGPRLSSAFAIMIIITMYFGGGMVPEYLNIRDLGMLNSLWSIIIPPAIATGNMIIMKSAFQAIPDSLTESARLDGASYFKVLIKIMLPLTKATLAVMVLYYGVSRWNGWFTAAIYLLDEKLYPFQLVMHNILSALDQTTAMEGVGADEMARAADLMKYALIVIGTFPIMLIYPFLQKHFVKGVMIGSVKG